MDKEKIKKLAAEYIDREKNSHFRKEIEDLTASENYEELNERFYTEIDFGTGGIRGIMGGGYNRINPYIIRKTTQGLADYINTASAGTKPSAVIAYDSRNYSDLLAREAALTLCANNIKVYLFSSLRSTPELSFAVRRLGCTAGIVITASHNPKEYNGYKAYWSDGAQVVPPHDRLIIDQVKKPGIEIKSIEHDDAVSKGLLEYIDEKIDKQYIEMVKNCFIRKNLIKEKGKDLKIVFTPLHGTAKKPFERVFSESGINLILVGSQADPDGNFPTVVYPNPEEASALALAIELAESNNADLVMGTDPDGDRIGIAVPDNGGFCLLNGNQLGSMLACYILSTLEEAGKIPENPVLIKTIVTTELQRLIGESFGVKVYDVLTGFKWIAYLISVIEKKGENYIFGGEESYGFLTGTEVRDKDAVSAAALIAEMAVYSREKGISLLEYLDEIYRKYGYFQETQVTGTFKGQKGLEIMKNLMKSLREKQPETIGNIKVVSARDYKNDIEIEGITLPKSDVLQFILEDGSIISARPSGTEPKIKFYISCREKPGRELSEAKKEVGRKVSIIEKELAGIINRGEI